MTPYYQDESVTLYHGKSLEVLRELPAGSVDCCVTSPPYYGLRDYGIEGQYGLEATPAEYVDTMRAVFGEVRRVLASDGTLWLNIGDSYSSGGRGSYDIAGGKTRGRGHSALRPTDGIPAAKNMLGIPWQVAFALQNDGWILRNAIVWNKPNAMPESVTDRLSGRYEHVFLFSKSRTYQFDLDPIRERHADKSLYQQEVARRRPHRQGKGYLAGESKAARTDGLRELSQDGRNPGDVWSIPTQPFAEAHFACMPVVLAERCVLAGCKPGGTVLDTFSGSGTTGLAAARHGRRYVGIDLNREYLGLSLRTRLAQAPLLDGESA